MTLTAQLCEKIVATQSLDGPALDAARKLVLDGVAVAVAGQHEEEAPRLLAEYHREMGTAPQASVLGQGFRIGVIPAAHINASAMHVLDFEPMWMPSTHALSPALAPILALAEWKGFAGRDIMLALVKGIEIQGWLRASAGPTQSKDLRFHPPGQVGPIGSAVASAHLLGLDEGKLANAIGIAASRCGGLFSNTGTMTKSSHCAYAASLGLEAALLADRGFTASPTALEGTQGFFDAFERETYNREGLLNFGPPFREVVEPGFTIKLFPAKFTTHYGITAGLALHPKIGNPENIKAVRMVAALVPSGYRPRPRTGLEGKFSIQYTLAAALLDGHVGMSSFTDASLFRPAMQALLGKIEATQDPTMTTIYNAGRYVEVEVDLADGTTLTERCYAPRGSWGAPPSTAEECLAKARDCLTVGGLPESDADAVIELAQKFETLDAEGVRRMLALARGHEHKPS